MSSITPVPRSYSVALAPGKARPWSVVQMTSVFVGEAAVVQAVEHRADALVERAGAGLEGGHVLAGRGRVGQVRRRQRVEGVAHRGRDARSSRWVSKKPTERKQGSGMRPSASIAVGATSAAWLSRPRSPRRSRSTSGSLGDVLLADQRRAVAGLAQRVDQVLAVVVERPAAVGEPEHAVVVAVLAGQERGAAARAGRRGAERLAGTARPGRPGAGCSASAPGSRRAAPSGRCRASGCRGCSAGRSGSSCAPGCKYLS